jgi:hypothetical protein
MNAAAKIVAPSFRRAAPRNESELGECQARAALYPKDKTFRSLVVMTRHGFGRGEYKCFSYPLSGLIADLRETICPYLVPVANRWNNAMGTAVQYPRFLCPPWTRGMMESCGAFRFLRFWPASGCAPTT